MPTPNPPKPVVLVPTTKVIPSAGSWPPALEKRNWKLVLKVAFPPLTGGGELAYALLPLPDVDKVMGLLPGPANFKIDGGRITVETPTPEQGGIVYSLDFNLHVIEYRFSDNFAALHRRLAVQNLLDHALTAEESQSLGKVVRFAAAPDGNSPALKRLWKF